VPLLAWQGWCPEFFEDDSKAADHRLWELSDVHSRSDYYLSSYDLKALYFLSINYILGVGCLGVPYAFARAGFLLCFAILLTVTALSYITVMWVAETGVRLDRRLLFIKNRIEFNSTTDDSISRDASLVTSSSAISEKTHLVRGGRPSL
jgi:hypothetical protein